jgi:hypothetical protein
MIYLLISTAWLAVVVLAIAVCRMAAHGDRVARRDAEQSALRSIVRSPRLLDLRHRQVLTLRLEDRRAQRASEPATAEHVGNRAQEDLYVRP